MPTPRLDWRPSEDPRNENFPLSAALRATAELPDREWWPGPVVTDQGQEGACVGHAWTNEAMSSPVPVDLTRLKAHAPTAPNLFAQFVYSIAQHLDEWGGENYDGTSTLAGAKAMQNLGLINEYRWATSTQDILTTITQKGPVILGSWWYEGMYTPQGGVLRISGTRVGGHAYLLNAYANHVPALGGDPGVQMKNSWGTGWGNGGFAWLPLDTLDRLFTDGGEACAATSRSYGRS